MAEAEHTFVQSDKQQNFPLYESDPHGFSGGEFDQQSIVANMHSEYGFVGNGSENQGFAGNEQGFTGNEQGFAGNDPEISYGVTSEQNYPENESERALDTNQGNEELAVSDLKQEFTKNEANETENVTENDNSQTQKKEVHENNVVGGSEKKWPGWPGESVFRMLIPVQKVGSVIGRKGEFIKKIVGETRSRVKVLEAPPGSQERAVMVSGRENPDASLPPAIDGLLRVHKRVVEGLDDNSSQAPPAGGKVSTKLLVPASQAGSLIGKQGATVKTIQETAACMVRVLGQEDVPALALQDDRVVEIAGDPANVHSALQLIASHLRKFLVDRSIIAVFEKQMQAPSTPMEHMPSQPWGPPHGFPLTAGGGHGYVPTPQYMQPPPRQLDNYYPTSDMPPPPDRQHQGISAYGREPPLSVNAASGAQPAQAQSMITQVTQHMQVPLLYADAVIGTNGATVSYIRRASGATVTIQESRGAPGEMTVEINGTASQVQTAQQLIQNFMADAGATTAMTQAGASTEQAYNQSYTSYTAAATPAAIFGSPASGTAHATQPNPYGSAYGTNYGY